MQNLRPSNIKVVSSGHLATIPVAVASGFIASNAPSAYSYGCLDWKADADAAMMCKGWVTLARSVDVQPMPMLQWCVKVELHQRVQWMLGEASKDFHNHVSHLVAGEVGSKKYAVAAQCGKEIMTPDWVDAVWDSARFTYVYDKIRMLSLSQSVTEVIKTLQFKNHYQCKHTHNHLTAVCPGLPGWAGTRKVKPQSGFYWSMRWWVAVASAWSYASLHLAPDR